MIPLYAILTRDAFNFLPHEPSILTTNSRPTCIPHFTIIHEILTWSAYEDSFSIKISSNVSQYINILFTVKYPCRNKFKDDSYWILLVVNAVNSNWLLFDEFWMFLHTTTSSSRRQDYPSDYSTVGENLLFTAITDKIQWRIKH